MRKSILLSITALTTLAFISSPLFAAEPKYKANVPKNIQTPDSIQTKYAGELKFTDGFPSDETVAKTYDFLDTARATMVFKPLRENIRYSHLKICSSLLEKDPEE